MSKRSKRMKFHRLAIGLFALYISLPWVNWSVDAARTANIVRLSTILEIEELEFDDLSKIDEHVSTNAADSIVNSVTELADDYDLNALNDITTIMC